MLREDGFVMDDGTTARLAKDRYVMSTTTANAARVMQHLEHARQILWPQLDVQIVSVTEQWAQYAIAGPQSRELAERLLGGALMCPIGPSLISPARSSPGRHARAAVPHLLLRRARLRTCGARPVTAMR